MPTPAKRPGSSLIASATHIKLKENPTYRKPAEWQRDAWQFYEEIGEIQHAVDYIANQISKVRLFGAIVPTDPRKLPSEDTDPRADTIIRALRTKGGEYSSILRELVINLFVAGEAFLVGRGASAENEVDYWEVLSNDELEWSRDRYLIRDRPSGPRTEYTEAELVVIHIIFSHPRWGSLPLSPIRGILASAEEIQRIERVIRGAAKSRAAGPGLLLIPDELSFPSVEVTDDTTPEASAASDPLLNALMQAMIVPIQDEGSAASVVPIFARGPGDVMDKVRKVSLGIDIDTELIKLDRAITRLAQGLPLPPEIVTGKEGMSHWCVDEETEIYTRRGWVGIDTVRVGDEALGLNHDTGMSEWHPISDVQSWDVNNLPMLKMSGKSHDSLSTLNHRWPVIRLRGRERVRSREWHTSSELNSADRITIAARCADVPIESKYSDALVELVAWFFTEGQARERLGRTTPQVIIYQSQKVNPGYCDRIRMALTALFGPPRPLNKDGKAGRPRKYFDPEPGWREVPRDRGGVRFILNSAAARVLIEHAPNRVVRSEFIHSLTHAQLELFISTAVCADGSHLSQSDTRWFGQKTWERVEAVELAAILAGYSVRRTEVEVRGFRTHTQHGISIGTRSNFAPHPKRQSQVSYTGRIWCPVIKPIQSMLARRNGAAFYTGQTAWSVSEDTVTAYIQPVLTPIVDALTSEYYRPYLEALGVSDPNTRQLWYDVTELITRPNRSADADFGLTGMALSDDAWRRIKGFTERDAPDPLERLARLLLQRGSLDPVSTVTLLQVLGIIPKDAVIPTNTQLPPTPGAPKSPNTPEDRSPPSKNRPTDAPPTRASLSLFLPPSTPDADLISSQLLELDRELRLRLHTAAEASVTRSLERASSKIITHFRARKTYATILRDTPKDEIGHRLGRAIVEAEGLQPSSLFDNAFDSLHSRFITWTTRTYARVARLTGLHIDPPTDLITSAADDFRSNLLDFSIHRLFNSHTPVESFGEYDDSFTLPHSIIRRCLYKAGGGTELLPSNTSPPGEIATGSIVLQHIIDAGGTVDGWEWCYVTSVRTRDFEPHAALNGVRFSSFTDPALANRHTWPTVLYLYPSDHDYCQCSIRPLLSLPDDFLEETA